MNNKAKRKPLTAAQLSKNTGVPLQQVEHILNQSYTLEEISAMTGIPLDTLRERARAEGWPYIEVYEGIH